MTFEPKCVDVVIPVHNGEQTVGAAIDSILAQQGNWVRKILVVDDGSLDKTVNVVRSRNDPVIQLFEIAHSGVANARNYGISQAAGDWIAFLDADDIWRVDKLDKQMAVAAKQRYKFICAESIDCSLRKAGPINAIDLWRGNFVVTSSVCIHITLVNQLLPLFKCGMSFAEDYLAWLRCLSLAEGYHINERLVHYSISALPRYRPLKIISSFTSLVIEYQKFTIRNGVALKYKLFAIALQFSIMLTLASIVKRYFRAHFFRLKTT